MKDELASIGKSIVIKGELSGGKDLTIEGQVEGKIKLRDPVLRVGSNGRIKAQIAPGLGRRPRSAFLQEGRGVEGAPPLRS